VDIKNNIFYANTTFGINTSAAIGSGVNIDHNLFYANPSGAYNLANNGSTVSYTTGTAINSDPGLANETLSSFDAHIKAGSPAIQSALNLSSTFTTDKAGLGRPASGAWDLGVYKFNSSGTTDTTAPTASITSPANGTTVSGTVTVNCNASDNVGVASLQFQCDGTNLGSAFAAAPYAVALNTTNLANGSHNLKAIARDAAGNQTTTTAVTVNVSNAAITLPTGITVTLAKVSKDMQLTWNSVTGKTYRVACANSLQTSWTNLSSNIVATGAITSWTDTTAKTVNQRFYRVYTQN
jgi:hypothetical protein